MTRYDKYVHARLNWLEAERNFTNAARIYNDLDYLRQERYRFLEQLAAELSADEKQLAIKDQFGK